MTWHRHGNIRQALAFRKRQGWWARSAGSISRLQLCQCTVFSSFHLHAIIYLSLVTADILFSRMTLVSVAQLRTSLPHPPALFSTHGEGGVGGPCYRGFASLETALFPAIAVKCFSVNFQQFFDALPIPVPFKSGGWDT